MKKQLKSILLCFILFLLFIIFSTKVSATSLASDELLKFKSFIIKTSTTVEQINDNFGQPRIECASAFGGKAYTYYDDEYTWMLHIETDEKGQIKGYGCINGDFVSRKYAQGDKYSSVVSNMSGTAIYDDNELVNGVYEYNVSASDVSKYKTNFLSSSDFLYDLQKSSLIVSRILAKKHNYEFPQTYIDEDIFYMNEELKDNGTDLYNFAKSTGKTKYVSLVLSRTDFLDYELPNPMMLGRNTENYTRAENYKYVFYDMKLLDKNTFNMFTTIVFVDPSFLEQKKNVELTANELSLLEAVKLKYKEYNTHGQAIVRNYDVEPVYKELPLVAGKWSDMALLMVTDYINLARVGLGLHQLELDQDIVDAAQHKATLVAYNNIKGYTSGHYPEQPDGVSDDFFKKAQSYMTENLYTGDIQSSIPSALNDAYGDPVECGHRYNLLDPSATKWGVGAVGSGLSFGWQAAHKFSGFEGFLNELVAWPSNGIFTMDLAYNGIGNWTARFYKNYKFTSESEVTIKCLNSGKVYEITQQNKNDSDKFLQVTGSSLLTFRNDTIAYENGDVFEITLHNVMNSANNEITDYTYRSVFANFSKFDEISVQDIVLDVNTLNLLVGEEKNVDAKIYPEDATNKLIKYTSSNEKVATIRQDGKIIANAAGKATIIVDSLDGSNVSKTISVTVKNNIDDPDYIKGDYDENGEVEITDAYLLLRSIVKEEELTSLKVQIVDMDDSGNVDITDAYYLLRYIVKNM